MSVLASLAEAYKRLPDAPPSGFSTEKVSALVTLRPDGSVAHVTDLRVGEGRKRQARAMLVPQPVKRTVAVAPNFLWDKTAYALGLTVGLGRRTAEEHAAFKARHAEWLEGSTDEGLIAFLRFLDRWSPEEPRPEGWSDDLLDANVVFAVESDWLRSDSATAAGLHLRPAAREAWQRIAGARAAGATTCLVTGEPGPVVRLHPSIKGVWGAQSSGGTLVAFNAEAYESYGHSQGDNAPVSEAAAFAYTTALNRFLAPGSRNRVQLGDASTVFWADSAEEGVALQAEALAFGFLSGGSPEDDAAQAKEVAAKLERIRQGAPLAEVEPRLAEGVRFHVLGLAPNAARLSVRFHWAGSFGALARNYQRFLEDLRLDPEPRGGVPPIWRLLREIAVQGKSENVPPGLAGDWMRAVLTGGRYPATLLATALLRIRSDQEVNGARAAVVKAVLRRNCGEEDLVALDEDNPSPAYQLGRLFAVLEGAQREALGQVNAPIGDRFYAAASSTPARVFAPLLRGLKHHVSDARKRGRGGWIEPRVGEIMGRLPPDLPRTLRLEDQGRFALGYYHERWRGRARAEDEDEEPVAEDAAPPPRSRKTAPADATPDLFKDDA